MLVSLLAAACSSSGGGDSGGQLATLDGGGASGDDALAATTTEAPTEALTFEEAQLDFSACMRETYPEWPDPEPDAQGGRGGFDPAVLEELGLDFRDEGFRTVLDACRDESFEGVAGVGQERSAEEQAELEDDLLALFACVRENPGYESLPDPDFTTGEGGGFGLRELFTEGDMDPQEFRGLLQECQTELGIEGGGRGPGGGRGGAGAGS